MLLIVSISLWVSCDNGTSYAELLTDETKSVNFFLAHQRVINEIPADSVFEVGENAPYYKMDEDGNVYMQVLNAGTKENKAESDQLIYFRFMRYNLHYWSLDGEMSGEVTLMIWNIFQQVLDLVIIHYPRRLNGVLGSNYHYII